MALQTPYQTLPRLFSLFVCVCRPAVPNRGHVAAYGGCGEACPLGPGGHGGGPAGEHLHRTSTGSQGQVRAQRQPGVCAMHRSRARAMAMHDVIRRAFIAIQDLGKAPVTAAAAGHGLEGWWRLQAGPPRFTPPCWALS